MKKIRAQEIVEWVDQAVLYLYLDPSEIASFRRAGARSVTDFSDLWRGFCVRYEVQPDGTFKRQPIGQGAGIASEPFDARRKAIAQQLQATEERLDALYRATEIGPNMHYVRTYWDSVEALEARARVALVREVCGRVGCVLRTSERDGVATHRADVLKQVVRLLLSAAITKADKVSHDNTAATLYGQAVLNRLLGDDFEARRLYEDCIKTYPKDPTAFNDFAWMLLQPPTDQSQYDLAFKHALKAVELVRKDLQSNALPGYLDTLALAHIRLKQPKKALELIDEAMTAWSKSNPERSQPKFLETLVIAADELVVQGSKLEAAKVLCRVLNSGYADATTSDLAKKSLQILLVTLVNDAKTPPPGKEKETRDVLRWVLDSKYADATTAALAKQLLGE